MGFFTYKCGECGDPALCPSATINTNSWMSDVLLVDKSGDVVLKGVYDGYGAIVVDEMGSTARLPLSDCYGFTVGTLLHRACADVHGSQYRGPSADSECQGWFFNQGPGGTYDNHDPRSPLAAFLLDLPHEDTATYPRPSEPAPDFTPRIRDLMVRFEGDRLSRAETIELFQHLVDAGVMAHLPGIYRRTARQFVAWGTLKPADGGAEQ